MEKLLTSLIKLKHPDWFIEIIYFLGGFTLLLSLKYLVFENLFSKIEISEFDWKGNALAILVLSYITGRILGLIAEIFIELFYFIAESFLLSKSKLAKIPSKKKVESFLFDHRQVKTLDPKSFENEITSSHLTLFLQENNLLDTFLKRTWYSGFFLRQFLAISIILFSLTREYIFLIIVIVLLYECIEIDRDMHSQREDMIKIFLAEKIKEDTEETIKNIN